MTSTVVVKAGIIGFLAWLALRGRGSRPPPPSGTTPGREPFDDIDFGDGPQILDFWRWPDTPLPLIIRSADRRLMGVYSPSGQRRLIAVVDSKVEDDDGGFLVVSISATGEFPATFPTRLPEVVIRG